MTNASNATNATNAPPTAETQRYFPIPVDALDNAVLHMDLHIKFAGQTGAPTLYRSAGLEFTPQDHQRLIDQHVKFLYVSASQHHIFRKALSARLDRTFADQTVKAQERARIIRESCSKMIEDLLLFPGDPEPVSAITDISRQFTDWSSADPESFTYLLNMSAHDFYTTTHMVNVGVGCGLLAKELFPDDREIFTLCVQGGLLHDLGKRNVPVEILNKEGKLTPEEWKLMTRHPADGYEELRHNPAITPTVLSMVRDHHERLDGKGYPTGLDAAHISRSARICAIVDVFDAITAARPYRGPTPPADTLKMMKDGRGSQFDPQMFDVWASLVTRMLEADPERAPAGSTTGPKMSLAALQGAAALTVDAGMGTRPQINLYSDNRRRYPRHDVMIGASATIVRAGKAMPVQPGEPFPIAILDVSRGGVRIRTPWPMSLNDLLSVEFALPGQDKKINRLCKVMRVRSTPDKHWLAGLSFVEADAAQAS